MRRSRTFHISGRVAGLDEKVAPDLTINISRVEGHAWLGVGAAPLTPAGEFRVDKLIPGDYELALFRSDRARIRARTRVTITDADLAGVVLAPYVPVKVTLRFAGGPSAVRAYLRGNAGDFVAHCLAAGGACEFAEVEPGKYSLFIAGPANNYVQAIRCGDERLNDRAIDISGRELTFDVTLAQATASIRGRIVNRDTSAPPVGIVMITVPNQDEIPDLPLTGVADQYGHFTFAHLRPGRYRFFAAEQADYAQWTNPALPRELETQGTLVELEDGATREIRLTLITKQALDEVRKKLGLN